MKKDIWEQFKIIIDDLYVREEILKELVIDKEKEIGELKFNLSKKDSLIKNLELQKTIKKSK